MVLTYGNFFGVKEILYFYFFVDFKGLQLVKLLSKFSI